jgi:hypothetical protein
MENCEHPLHSRQKGNQCGVCGEFLQTEIETIKAVLNDSIIEKLGSMSQDIKVYVNANVGIYQSLGEEERELWPVIAPEDMIELIEIRQRIKILHRKLKKQ